MIRFRCLSDNYETFQKGIIYDFDHKGADGHTVLFHSKFEPTDWQEVLENESGMRNLRKEDGQTYFESNKRFKIDFDKVNSIDDIKIVLKALDYSVYWYSEECPEQFKEINEKGFLIEIK